VTDRPFFRRARARLTPLTALAATLALGALATTLGACGENSSPEAPASGLDDGSGGTFQGSGASGNGSPAAGGSGGSSGTGNISLPGSGGGTAEPPPPPPEEELETAYEAPVATDHYVWTANPASGKVALISADDFSVRLAEAGAAPTTVAALPGHEEDAALVLNAGSDDATVLRLGPDGAIASQTLKTHAGANAVAVSPSGKWALIWSNAALEDANTLDPTDGLQDVTVAKLDEAPVPTTILTVGYRPSAVSFDDAEEHAFFVTAPGMTVVDLGDAPHPDRDVELTENPVSDQAARDVSVTPDGAYAVVRLDGEKTLGFVELATGARSSVTLPDYVTDLDLSADGKRAFAVSGGALVVVPVPPGDADPSTFARAAAEGEVGRSVTLSPDASLALLYSNATADQYLGILTGGGDWSSYEARAVDLKAPVRAAFAAPDGRHGITFQTPAAGGSKAGAFSIVSAQLDRAPKIIGTDAPPTALAFSPDGARAVITTRDLAKQRYGMYLVELASLAQTFIQLSSPPLSAGIVGDYGFVAQAHPEGRITFVNLTDASQRTLTGFELAAKVTQ
jgi:hypothetical protein